MAGLFPYSDRSSRLITRSPDRGTSPPRVVPIDPAGFPHSHSRDLAPLRRGFSSASGRSGMQSVVAGINSLKMIVKTRGVCPETEKG